MTGSSARLRAGTPAKHLSRVLRDALDTREAVRLLVGTVVSVPDAGHVVVTLGGGNVTVPRLASYTPAAGEPCYLLASPLTTIALGTVEVT